MKSRIYFIRELVKKGGPYSSEYHEFSDWLQVIHTEMNKGILNTNDLQEIRGEMGEALSVLTLQGFVYNKPHGYPGDYEIIEKIYLGHTSDNPELRKWDLYFQLQKAPLAVRNRKNYFLDILNALAASNSGTTENRVLNIASGPARDLFDFFSQSEYRNIAFDNVEFDFRAISYAKNLCKDYLGNIHFLHANAFDFTTDRKYRLIWSAGLFDYLTDEKFMFLLNRILPLLEDDGELVVGNFSTDNPTLPYMEVIGDWRLRYRRPEDLRGLARACGLKEADIRIGKEPEGVNLFLHIKKGAEFITTVRT